ncbi:MAG: hypothetical protein J2P54_18410 [Bradyrhizobiaceae bacterium]|nr:hypothetical protein [Bradyrhizobiaceae bacterium]
MINVLECVTDFPDDQIEDGDRIVQPGGRAVAFVIADLLKEYGMITTTPQLDYEHGWQFEAAQDQQLYMVQTTDPSEQNESRMIICAEDQSPLVRRWLGRNKYNYVRFLNTLRRLLSQDKWFISVSGWESIR